ncbi:septum site-determining protein MinC [Halalkalibacillus sediminis]|uniref:Probable septum site-determining protein MinC n=1 Tax=Halalkalibacillus sediminis TaxID=2018042 RepID=A0A2I0QXS3_9BACI|nr:septum site-determining protein MinC [Halalkalibacillus sediminis]PKR79119.1 septum site-determining protein MinC [Halalkalibacillus sediminis]
MMESNHLITMKGTNHGIIVYLDDRCSFDSILKELEEKVTSSIAKDMTEITVDMQYRYVNEEQEQMIRDIVENNSALKIKTIESNVISKVEANEWLENQTLHTVMKTIRSGQVHKIKGDALLLGDVNPGGTIQATGNIYIMGKLNGIAHAGYDGDKKCVVMTSYMNPNQIRIADKISRAPDYETEGADREFAYINLETDQIEINQVQHLQKIRPSIADLSERGL